MKPTFECEGAALYLGDSAEIIPQLTEEFDMLATDPPYGVEFQSGRREKSDAFDVLHGDSGEVDIGKILSLAVKRLRQYRHAYIFGPSEPLSSAESLTAHAQLIWDKDLIGMGDLSVPWGPAHEAINFAINVPSKSSRNRGDGRLSARLRSGSIIKCRRPNGTGVKRHPTEKPVALMQRLIESSSCVGETVFDPFMGSGSTIVAAILEGRRGVGIEYDPKYFEIAVARAKAASEAMARVLEAA